MRKKKRQDIQRLREVQKFARDYEVRKGLIHEESVIDRLARDPNAPVLPGLPSYLPRPWTIHQTRRVVYDLGREWQATHKENPQMAGNIAEFAKFGVSVLNEQVKKHRKSMKDMSKVVDDYVATDTAVAPHDVFKPIENYETAKAIRQFIIDSLAVAIIVKRYDDTADFLEWFMGWTNQLLDQWTPQQRLIK